MKLITSLLASMCVVGVWGVANAANLPPNTITIDTQQNPVLSRFPTDITQYVAPSIPSMVNTEIQDYLSSQLTPQQMGSIKATELEKNRVLATPYVDVPRPVIRSMAVNLGAGETPPVIRLAKNMITNIVLTDSDGNPWAIEKIVVNGQQFINHTSLGTNEQGETVETNIVTLEPTTAVSWSNMTVVLKGKTIPVMFILTAGQPEVDMRVDAHVQGRSPNAQYKVGSSIVRNVTDIDNNSLNFLDGSIPAEAEELKTNDPAVRAWELNGKVYARTRFDVLYPAYSAKASTAEEMHIYRFDNVLSEIGSATLTFTQRSGQPVTVRLEKNPNSYLNR